MADLVTTLPGPVGAEAGGAQTPWQGQPDPQIQTSIRIHVPRPSPITSDLRCSPPATLAGSKADPKADDIALLRAYVGSEQLSKPGNAGCRRRLRSAATSIVPGAQRRKLIGRIPNLLALTHFDPWVKGLHQTYGRARAAPT